MRLPRLSRLALCAAVLAFVVRLTAVCVLGTWHFSRDIDHPAFRSEIGRTARSLAEGKGYITPFGTGEPSAWTAPLYPLLLAGILSALGVHSDAAALAILFFQCVMGAATVLVLHSLGRRWVGDRGAAVAAFGFAIYPPAVYFSAGIVVPSGLTVLLVTTLLLFAEIHRGDESPKAALTGGLAVGFTALVDPVCLVLLPCILFAIVPRSAALATRIRVVILAIIGTAIALAPWTARNYIVLGDWVPIKSNFGEALWLGNNDHATGHERDEGGRHLLDFLTPDEKARIAGMSEIARNRWLLGRAIEWARAHPGRVFKLSLRRAGRYWWQTDFRSARELATRAGPTAMAALTWSYPILLLLGVVGLYLAFRQRLPVGTAVLFFALYPLGYYVTHVSVYRYRYPVEPFLLIFAALTVASLSRYLRVRTPGSS